MPPEAFADFVARRQHVHPATRREGGRRSEPSLSKQLQGFEAPAEVWESELAPSSESAISDPAWPDEALLRGRMDLAG